MQTGNGYLFCRKPSLGGQNDNKNSTAPTQSNCAVRKCLMDISGNPAVWHIHIDELFSSDARLSSGNFWHFVCSCCSEQDFMSVPIVIRGMMQGVGRYQNEAAGVIISWPVLLWYGVSDDFSYKQTIDKEQEDYTSLWRNAFIHPVGSTVKWRISWLVPSGRMSGEVGWETLSPRTREECALLFMYFNSDGRENLWQEEYAAFWHWSLMATQCFHSQHMKDNN